MKLSNTLKIFSTSLIILLFNNQTAGKASAGALLQGLDKVTARIKNIQAPINQFVAFGSLRLCVRACIKRPPEEFPESSAFLEVFDEHSGQARTPIFSGWMFASSPSLSSMEHAIYDIWVVDCIKSKISR
ncbi:MAG: glycosyl hydrolase family 5 [Rhodospirillales bacterium]|nr:glycosyl hydrolase family 5 [Rhodospirillales bacterium]